MKSEVIKLIEGRDDVTLTTYILADSPEMLAGQKRPAVIVCPGGAYFSCSDREGEPVALAFANMGYHAFVLRYSVYGGNGFEMDLNHLPIKEECQHPRPMQDIGRAMLYIREHAEEWLVDTERIAICGFSAGAHNCAMYETNWSKPVMTDYFKCEAKALRPAACILGYPLTDYLYMKENTSDNPFDATFFNGSNTAFLGEDRYTDERMIEVSPAHNVDTDTPPTYIWSTAADNLVPVQHAIRMAHALADKKIPFELHIFEEGPHGLSTSTQASVQAKSQMYPDAAKWVGLCGAWLEKRFALPLPDKTPYEDMMFN